jgi:probable F420-dependent oxidoreductase
MTPFRFEVNVGPSRSLREWTDKARKIEDLGYSTLNVSDHLANLLAPMPAIVSAASATTRLRVGTNVLNNDLRHPVLVAHEAATVDILTDGRLQLGLGAGSIRAEYDAIGATFDTGGTRVARLAEATTIIKGLLAGEKVTLAGRHYRVSHHAIEPLPVQKPRPPILIGGNNRHLLSLAAREADVVGFSGITFRQGGAVPPDLSAWRVPATDERVGWVRAAAGADRFASLGLTVLVQRVVVTDDRRGAAEELTGRWPQLTADEFLQTPYLLIGTVEQMVEDLLARRKRWGFSSYVIREDYIDAFAPVLARVTGM